ncbi:MAG: hypothetical protein HQK77_19685 [Desulfobacterales bacterium]|nr:hypothetical protein [Desulfobacterales bacterium]
MTITSELLQLLMEIGYLAGGYGLLNDSETIFEAIKSVRPESEYPLIGLAVTKMNANNNEDAIAILKNQALKVNPQSDLARSFLGLALKHAGYGSESQSVLQEVLNSGKDAVAVKMAQAILDGN